MSDSYETLVEASGLESSRPNLTAFIVCLGCVVVLLDVSIVNVALQRISNGLGGRVSDLQWIVDAYTLAFASFLLTGGTAGDRYGNKQVFGAGVCLIHAGIGFLWDRQHSASIDYRAGHSRSRSGADNSMLADASKSRFR
jgi:hypothetical protein